MVRHPSHADVSAGLGCGIFVFLAGPLRHSQPRYLLCRTKNTSVTLSSTAGLVRLRCVMNSGAADLPGFQMTLKRLVLLLSETVCGRAWAACLGPAF
jgi:hypothetical protein